jgi:hypothetical protein
MSAEQTQGRGCSCAGCAHLIHDPVEFERALPGILILSSGQGDSRGDQGLCRIHEQLVTPEMTCPHFEPRVAAG